MHNKDRSHYQYALLNMAILQADFGCFEEAIAAMNETIAMARENKDMDCLNFSLSWVYHFRTAHMSRRKTGVGGLMVGSDEENLKFLKAEAKDRRMWSILSSTLLNEAKLCLSRVTPQPYHFQEIGVANNSHSGGKHSGSFRASLRILLSQCSAQHYKCSSLTAPRRIFHVRQIRFVPSLMLR